jgi:hypothetical protein
VKADNGTIYYGYLTSNRDDRFSWEPVSSYSGTDPAPKVHLRGSIPTVVWSDDTPFQYNLKLEAGFDVILNDTLKNVYVAMKGASGWHVSRVCSTRVHSIYPEVGLSGDYLAFMWLQGRYDVYRLEFNTERVRAYPGLSLYKPSGGEIYSPLNGDLPIIWGWEAPYVDSTLYQELVVYDGDNIIFSHDTITYIQAGRDTLYLASNLMTQHITESCEVRVKVWDNYPDRKDTVALSSDTFSIWWLVSPYGEALSGNGNKIAKIGDVLRVLERDSTKEVYADSSTDDGETWVKRMLISNETMLVDYYNPQYVAHEDTLYFLLLKRVYPLNQGDNYRWYSLYSRSIQGTPSSDTFEVYLGQGNLTGGHATFLHDSLYLVWTMDNDLHIGKLYFGDTLFSDTLTIETNDSTIYDPYIYADSLFHLNVFWVEPSHGLISFVLVEEFVMPIDTVNPHQEPYPIVVSLIDTLYQSTGLRFPTATVMRGTPDSLFVSFVMDSNKIMVMSRKVSKPWGAAYIVYQLTDEHWILLHPRLFKDGIIWTESDWYMVPTAYQPNGSKAKVVFKNSVGWSNVLELEYVERKLADWAYALSEDYGDSLKLYAIWQENWVNATKIAFKDTVLDAGFLGGPQSGERVYIFRLYPVAPNPSFNEMVVRYSIPSKGKVTMKVYDVAGRCVKTLVDGIKNPGIYLVDWKGDDHKGRNLPTGVYFIRLKFEGQKEKKSAVRKVILMRR